MRGRDDMRMRRDGFGRGCDWSLGLCLGFGAIGCLLVMACAGKPPAVAASAGTTPAAPATVPAAPTTPTLYTQAQAGRPSMLAGVKDAAVQKAIMREVSTAMGVQCDYCHDVSDYAAPTLNARLSNLMFVDYSVKLRLPGGAVMGCVECHRGQARVLGDRAERARIIALMKGEYVDRMTDRAGAAIRCETCHGPERDKNFLPRE